MERLIGRVVEMIVGPGVVGAEAALGEVLYALAVGDPEGVRDNPDGYFSKPAFWRVVHRGSAHR